MTIAAASSHARHIRRSPRACRRAVPSSRNAGKEVRCFDKLSTNGRKSGVKALTLRIIGQKGQPAIGLDAAIEAGAAPGVARGASGSDAPPQQIGSAHVRTPVTNAHLVCRILLEKKNTN